MYPDKRQLSPGADYEGGIKLKSHALVISVIGPLQLAIHVVQNRCPGEQKSHWDKTKKETFGPIG